MFVDNSNEVSISGGSFLGNRAVGSATQSGGGAASFQINNVLEVEGVTFTSNSADSGSGGAVLLGSSPSPVVFRRCTLQSNVAQASGGGVGTVAGRGLQFHGLGR